MKKYLRYGGLGIVFLWFFGGGVMHFINPDIFVAIVPPWVPYALAAVYISGFFEVVLALLIIWPKSRPMAGWGLVALAIAVTPANVHMWLHPELFPEVDPSDLSVRLVIQVVLLFTIWWSTRIEQKGLEETGPGTLPGSTT